MSEKNGGSAFPEVFTDSTTDSASRHYADTYSCGGITLRDYFAAKAMAMASEDDGGTIGDASKELGIPAEEYKSSIHWPLLMAKRAYGYADAMIAEREKPQEAK